MTSQSLKEIVLKALPPDGLRVCLVPIAVGTALSGLWGYAPAPLNAFAPWISVSLIGFGSLALCLACALYLRSWATTLRPTRRPKGPVDGPPR